MPTRFRNSLVLIAIVACGGDKGSNPETEQWVRQESAAFTLAFRTADSTVARTVQANAVAAVTRVEQTFESRFRSRFDLVVYPNRTSMIDRWRQAWNQPGFQSECWMVAAGWEAELSLLSPRVWATQACGHDGSSTEHVSLIVSHELVHVLHAQWNRSYGTLQSTTPWLSEGLAVWASGQYPREYGAQAVAAARSGSFPTSFQALWSSSAGYALSGATIAYLVDTSGGSVIYDLLAAESWASLLVSLGVSEGELIVALRAWLLA